MKYRIRNAVKLDHMGKMRLGVAQQDTIDYLKKAIIPKEQHPKYYYVPKSERSGTIINTRTEKWY